MDSDGISDDNYDQPQLPPQHHHHSFLSELGKTALDIGKGVVTGVATDGIVALL